MTVTASPSLAPPRITVTRADPPRLRVTLAQQGPSGPPGISADEGQLITLGTDNLPLVTADSVRGTVTTSAVSVELAAAPRQIVEITAPGQTVTLPDAPTAGDEIVIFLGAFTAEVEPLGITIGISNPVAVLRYLGAGGGWRLIQ